MITISGYHLAKFDKAYTYGMAGRPDIFHSPSAFAKATADVPEKFRDGHK